MNKHIVLLLNIIILNSVAILPVNAFDFDRSVNRQQVKSTDSKGNTIYITPNYSSYEERNYNVSEKVVAIYDKKSPAYGYRYILYTPIRHYVGHHRVMQPSPNGYGYSPIPEGGEGSSVPCFQTIREAKHYYYPQWY